MTKHNGHQGSRGGTRLKEFTGRFRSSDDPQPETAPTGTDADHERHMLPKTLIGLVLTAVVIAVVVRMLGGKGS